MVIMRWTVLDYLDFCWAILFGEHLDWRNPLELGFSGSVQGGRSLWDWVALNWGDFPIEARNNYWAGRGRVVTRVLVGGRWLGGNSGLMSIGRELKAILHYLLLLELQALLDYLLVRGATIIHFWSCSDWCKSTHSFLNPSLINRWIIIFLSVHNNYIYRCHSLFSCCKKRIFKELFLCRDFKLSLFGF